MDKVSLDNVNIAVRMLFTLQFFTKMNHFNTESYARHKATDSFYEKLTNNIDRLVEVLIGRYNIKPKFNKIGANEKYMSDSGMIELFIMVRNYLESEFSNIFTDTSVLTIRDEIVGDINNTLYLFNLK